MALHLCTIQQSRPVWSNCSINAINTFVADAYGQPAFCKSDELGTRPPPIASSGQPHRLAGRLACLAQLAAATAVAILVCSERLGVP